MSKKNSRFKIVYGRDSLHARSGPDHPDPGPEFAPDRGDNGSGYYLKKFRGKYLDSLSIEELKDHDAAEREVFEAGEDLKFLSKIGCITDGTTLKS